MFRCVVATAGIDALLLIGYCTQSYQSIFRLTGPDVAPLPPSFLSRASLTKLLVPDFFRNKVQGSLRFISCSCMLESTIGRDLAVVILRCSLRAGNVSACCLPSSHGLGT